MVDAPDSRLLAKVMLRAVKDRDPHVLRSVGRVLRGWGESDPDSVADFIASCPGGMPKRLRELAEKGVRKGRRK